MKNHLPKSWLHIDAASDFSLFNLPFGIISYPGNQKKPAVAIGDHAIDLEAAFELAIFDNLAIPVSSLQAPFLNDLIATGKSITNGIRERLQTHLTDENSPLKDSRALVPRTAAEVHLPVAVRDYTDFYSSIEHATNVGKMFRDPENALLPNWKHLPVGYHGRASSIIVSGQDIHRPYGQLKPADGPPIYGATNRLDFELEMAFIIGKSTKLGETISTQTAEDHIFGMVLFNDWSARDVQKWEYVPLGPFLAKSFASSISPWVVPLEALDPFRVPGPTQEPAVLPYLSFDGAKNYDVHLSVNLMTEKGTEATISQTNFKHMYWNMAQQLTHHTMNGCNINIGDMMASGTISGPSENSFGSMLELSWGGKNPISIGKSEERAFLQDHDTVIMKGHAIKDQQRVGFGEVRTKILPAR